MKTIETVYNKLNKAKTELATHKVELALIDELTYIKGVETFGKNIDIDKDELNKIKTSIKVDLEDLENDLNALKKGIIAVKSAAKQLGINANEIPKNKEAVNAVSYGEKQFQIGKKLL